MAARTCITGAGGRLGRVLVDAFRERGDEIIPEAEGRTVPLNYLVFAGRYRGEPSYESEMYVNLERVWQWINAQQWANGDRATVLDRE